MAARHRPDRANRSLGSTRPVAADRLWHALATLLDLDKGLDRAAPVFTTAHLCELASVSRNSLYRYHGDAEKVIKALRKQRRRPESGGESNIANHRDWLHKENASLRKNIEKLVALVDHFYLAYQETSALCQRRERELAEARRSLESRPIPLRH